MYFYNHFRGMHMDFSIAFHPIPVPDFEDVYPVRAAVAQRQEYLAKKLGPDISTMLRNQEHTLTK